MAKTKEYTEGKKPGEKGSIQQMKKKAHEVQDKYLFNDKNKSGSDVQ